MRRWAPLAGWAAVGGAILFWISPTFGLMPPLYRYNTSVSVPPGAYIWTPKWPPERGDIVMVRDPEGFNLSWLLKRVEGVGGDMFCWHEEEGRHYVNDRPMIAVPPEAVAMGIPVWRGCLKLADDEVAGFGDHHLAYGSQYLGPVRHEQLWGVYRRRED